MRLKIELDQETTTRLVAASVRAQRPFSMHAAVLLRHALGLPVDALGLRESRDTHSLDARPEREVRPHARPN